MARKPGPLKLYPIGIRGEETGDAICATSITGAKQALNAYQNRNGTDYYLMNGTPYDEARVRKYRIVSGSNRVPPSSARPRLVISPAALARRQRMMEGRHLD